MSSSSPWDRLSVPGTTAEINMLRVDDEHRWNLFWGRSSQNRLLIARLKSPVSVPSKLPSFKGLQLTLDSSSTGVPRSLMLKLLDDRSADIFQLLCHDIVEATRTIRIEQELVNEIVSRTWRWHRFLQKGRSGLLSPEEQRGLIGELAALEQLCIPIHGPDIAVEGWTGPVGTARDFAFGATCLEVKAKRAPALPFVDISSEFQLDPEGLDTLLLVVVDVTSAPDSHGRSLTDVVDSMRDALQVHGEALEQFDERLMAAGYLSTDDYSQWQWTVGPMEYFDVTDGFPSIRHSTLPAGVTNVEYRLSLQLCHRFELPRPAVESRLRGQSNE